MLSIATALLYSAAAATTVPAGEVEEPNPKAMSQSEIRAFNAKLDKDHKYYIRCKKSAAIGSHIARTFSCRTNAQWIEASQRGNDNAREIMDTMSSKASSNG